MVLLIFETVVYRPPVADTTTENLCGGSHGVGVTSLRWALDKEGRVLGSWITGPTATEYTNTRRSPEPPKSMLAYQSFWIFWILLWWLIFTLLLPCKIMTCISYETHNVNTVSVLSGTRSGFYSIMKFFPLGWWCWWFILLWLCFRCGKWCLWFKILLYGHLRWPRRDCYVF